MTGVFDASPIAEEAICLAAMVVVITACSPIMITETPIGTTTKRDTPHLRPESRPSNKKRLSVKVGNVESFIRAIMERSSRDISYIYITHYPYITSTYYIVKRFEFLTNAEIVVDFLISIDT